MPWSNARTCRRPCHAARSAPRLTPIQVLLIAVCMGSLSTVTGARVPGTGSAAAGLGADTLPAMGAMTDPSDDPPAAGTEKQGGLFDSDKTDTRDPRSTSVFNKIINRKWLVSKNSYFVVIHLNGTVATTRDRQPRMGELVFGATMCNNNSRHNLFSMKDEGNPVLTTIMGQESRRYLCINRRGTVYSTLTMKLSDCGFNSTLQEHQYDTFCVSPLDDKCMPKSTRMRCLGVTRRGKIKNARKVLYTSETAKFSSIPVKQDTSKKPPIRLPTELVTQPTVTKRPTKRPCGGSRPSRRRKGCRRKRPKKKPQPTECNGLFCKKSPERSSRGNTRRSGGRDPHRKGRAPGSRRKQRRARRQRKRERDRPRRDHDSVVVEGPLSHVT